MDHCVIETPAGRLCIWELEGCIAEAAWVTAPLRAAETPLLETAAREVDAYFKRARRTFDLPLAMPGSSLEQAVWQAILRIPYGRTMTAAALAEKLGLRKKTRAVIAACNSNPVALFVPCHRIVAEDGDGGYVGGLTVKHALWQVEGIRSRETK